MGICPELLPCEPERLQHALACQERGLLLLDLSLVPAVLPVLPSGHFQVIGVTTLRHDPRTAKLAQWGAPTLHLSQVPGYLAHSLQVSPNLTPSIQSHQVNAVASPPLLQAGLTPAIPSLQSDLTPPVQSLHVDLTSAGQSLQAIQNLTLPSFSQASFDGAQLTAVHSPKGGAGTSTIAAHLAASWARQGLRVLLVDLSSYGATAILCKARQQGTGLEALAATVEMAPDCLAEDFDLVPYLVPLAVPPGRLDLLTGARPRLMDRFTPPQVMALLTACTRHPYDAVVVDTASEPTVRTLAALESVHRLILVATPDYTTCWNLIHLQDLLQTLRLKAERLLVLNRYTGSGISPEELQHRLGVPLAAVFPEHTFLRELGNHGKPWDLQPGDPFGDAVAQLAAALHTPAAVSLHG